MTKNTNSSRSLWIIVWELCRPFTLLAPFIGFVAFALASWKGQNEYDLLSALPIILLGAFSAATLNAASNIINQYFDLDIDRINKPTRPLPSGELSIPSALWCCGVLYGLSFMAAYLVGVQFFTIVLFTAFVTYAYSGPPFRTKRHWFWANFTIAIPRGCLLIVAGWTAMQDMWMLEPWLIGLIFGLYILGAASTKDFADMKGDEEGGCITLPLRFGVETSTKIITPFFILPFLLLFVFAYLDLFSANRYFLMGQGLGMAMWGGYVAYLIVRKPSELATEANHVSWKHMYLMMVVGQIGIVAAYLLH
jgi:4-hydroxybenzoate polyprenyltransferase